MVFSFGSSQVLYWCNRHADQINNLVRFCAFHAISSVQVPYMMFYVIFRKNSDSGISSWDWNLSGQHSTYHALFPRAWTVYDGMQL